MKNTGGVGGSAASGHLHGQDAFRVLLHNVHSGGTLHLTGDTELHHVDAAKSHWCDKVL